MDPRLDAGRLTSALGALILLIGLFLDWYGAPGGFEGDGVTAWSAFEIVDLILTAIALAVLLVAGRELASRDWRASPRALLAGSGPTALVLVLASLIDEPPAVLGASLEEGAWVSFAGAALMSLGSILGAARISLVVAARDDIARPGPSAAEAADPEAETRTYPPR